MRRWGVSCQIVAKARALKQWGAHRELAGAALVPKRHMTPAPMGPEPQGFKSGGRVGGVKAVDTRAQK